MTGGSIVCRLKLPSAVLPTNALHFFLPKLAIDYHSNMALVESAQVFANACAQAAPNPHNWRCKLHACCPCGRSGHKIIPMKKGLS